MQALWSAAGISQPRTAIWSPAASHARSRGLRRPYRRLSPAGARGIRTLNPSVSLPSCRGRRRRKRGSSMIYVHEKGDWVAAGNVVAAMAAEINEGHYSPGQARAMAEMFVSGWGGHLLIGTRWVSTACCCRGRGSKSACANSATRRCSSSRRGFAIWLEHRPSQRPSRLETCLTSRGSGATKPPAAASASALRSSDSSCL